MHTKPATPVRLVAAALACLLAACGSGGNSTGAAGTGSPTGGAGSTGTCPDLFDQGTMRTYSIDIAPDQWNAIQAEFNDLATLQADGNDFVAKHPVVFHMGSETVSDATFKLHGQSSWVQTVMYDGAK